MTRAKLLVRPTTANRTVVLFVSLFAWGVMEAEETAFERRARLVEEHYAKWIGVPAPEIGADARVYFID